MQQETYRTYNQQQQQRSLSDTQRYQQQMASCSDVLVTDISQNDKKFIEIQQG